ncbi:Putative signal transducing protein [Desulfatibacillum alkenivorans DSM 16219]|jgi:hypothetical protein|uniref:Putative signal transducing protein n=1 Tax=Desulfatibacillum alkenivorans DSM 16219 TaxID=1121393 RepID=A0A1M6CPN3_9BACT|nr:DUF2007 domain-containing protein [Desulfatibacillum alkenivorans]SHI62754.1 Putative signal transducing protein [Desulfatibacillum alkenivorans DSM 16219]
MIKVFSPNGELETAFIKSLFNGEGIPFYIHNDHFGSLEIGPSIYLYNKKTVLVPEEMYEKARNLITDLVIEPHQTGERGRTAYPWKEKVRVIMEFLLLSWFIPPRKKIRSDNELP